VNDRLSHRNKAAFSVFSGVVWTRPKKSNKKNNYLRLGSLS